MEQSSDNPISFSDLVRTCQSSPITPYNPNVNQSSESSGFSQTVFQGSFKATWVKVKHGQDDAYGTHPGSPSTSAKVLIFFVLGFCIRFCLGKKDPTLIIHVLPFCRLGLKDSQRRCTLLRHTQQVRAGETKLPTQPPTPPWDSSLHPTGPSSNK